MKKLPLLLGIVAALTGLTAYADEANDNWLVTVGAHVVDPQSNNGTLADGAFKAKVGSDVKPTVTGEYLFTPNWGVELLAALPFSHDVKLNGEKAATVDQLPPTVSVQYHFLADSQFSPFVGVGLNYTMFFNIHETGPLTGARLDLQHTFGPALHVGVDYKFDKNWLFMVDARWMNIEPDAKVNGNKVGTVKIDPLVYGVAIGYTF